MVSLDLRGKTAFITGASRGIGKKIKEVFEEAGAQVVAPGREELDLSSRESVEAYISENHPAPDIFVHCAGINLLAGIDEISYELADSVFQVNYFSPLRLIQSFSANMKKNKFGRIVLISSIYAIVSRERRIAYSSSKNADTGMMKSLAIELAEDGILINSVAPGYVLTDMTKQNLSQEEIESLRLRIPTRRLQTEKDIADTCLFLVSELNNSITGQIIAVDGGFTLL